MPVRVVGIDESLGDPPGALPGPSLGRNGDRATASFSALAVDANRITAGSTDPDARRNPTFSAWSAPAGITNSKADPDRDTRSGIPGSEPDGPVRDDGEHQRRGEREHEGQHGELSVGRERGGPIPSRPFVVVTGEHTFRQLWSQK